MTRATFGTLLVAAAVAAATASAPNVAAAAKPHADETGGHMLFCAYWSYAGTAPPAQASYESHFAVAVVEIDSPAEVDNVSVSDLSLFGDKDVTVARMQRLLKVDVFDEPYTAGESNAKYYLNTDPNGRTRPWDGVLPAGKVRLRASAAVVEDPSGVRGCKLEVGRYVIEGPVTFSLAT